MLAFNLSSDYSILIELHVLDDNTVNVGGWLLGMLWVWGVFCDGANRDQSRFWGYLVCWFKRIVVAFFRV